MNFWILMQVVLDLVIVAAVAGLWFRLGRPAKDDPRLSKGLQLLQSKISILEDLSDRTDTQVSQLTTLMETKVKDVQSHILNADKQIQTIERSMQKSLEVAKIFQDRIPHQEIIERQNTIKYVRAARMAHQGVPVADIAKEVDLSRGELEFIAKINRDQLQFSEEDLPTWARSDHSESHPQHKPGDIKIEKATVPESIPHAENESLSDLGNRFRKAIGPAELEPVQLDFGKDSKGNKVEVKKVVFPRVNINSNLS